MSDAPTNFDPYLDWLKITTEQAREVADQTLELRRAQKNLILYKTPSVAAEVIKMHHRLQDTISDVCESIWTVPAMVHLASEPKEEEWEESPTGEAVIQRCKRCGSILHFWYRGMGWMTPSGPQMIEQDEVDWWKTESVVAKATLPNSMTAYAIRDRPLEPHEMECVALPDMEV